MSETDKAFAGSIPAIYERYLVPLIFEPYAIELVGRLAGMAEGALLETAAGTGIVTRMLARSLPDSVSIVASDLNQAMLDSAMARTPSSRVVWRQADALALPFADASFDVVLCQFGAMFFPDRPTGYREALRVLKPGGRFILSVWDRIEENEFSDLTAQAVAALFPDDPPRFLDRTPYGHHDCGLIADELRAAGFAGVQAQTVARRARAASARDPAVGFCQGTPLRSEIEARDPARLGEATDAAARRIAERFGNGAVDGRIQAHVLTAAKS